MRLINLTDNCVAGELSKIQDISFIKVSDKLDNYSYDEKLLVVGDNFMENLKSLNYANTKNFLFLVFSADLSDINEFIKNNDFIFFGLRNLSIWNRQILDKNNIKYYEMKNIEDLEYSCDGMMELVNNSQKKIIFLLDFSVLDPAFVNSIKNKVPGGLSSRELIYFSKRFSLLKNIYGVNISGLDFLDDKNTGLVGSKLAAMVFKEFIK